MKVLHAGDLHLGANLQGLTMPVDDRLSGAVERAFQRLIAMALQEDVDIVLLPGDVFDSPHPDGATKLLFLGGVQRLAAAGIHVFMAAGNHDFGVALPVLPGLAHLHIFADQTVSTFLVTTKSGASVAVSAFSYRERYIEASLAPEFSLRQADVDYHLGMWHGQTTGRYAPFTVADLLSKQYDYWALGHIHARQTLHEHPFIGYSGNTQGLTKKEVGDKGVLVTDLTNQTAPKFFTTGDVVWEETQLTADQTEASQLAELLPFPPKRAGVEQLVTVQHVTRNPVSAVLAEGGQLLAGVQDALARIRPDIRLVDWQVELVDQTDKGRPIQLPVDWERLVTDLVTVATVQEVGVKQVDDLEMATWLLSDESMANLRHGVLHNLARLEREIDHED